MKNLCGLPTHIQGQNLLWSPNSRTKALVSQSAELTYNTDIADPDTGRLFIEMTHEKYRATLSDQFGLLIPVMFNDEPGLNPNP